MRVRCGRLITFCVLPFRALGILVQLQTDDSQKNGNGLRDSVQSSGADSSGEFPYDQGASRSTFSFSDATTPAGITTLCSISDFEKSSQAGGIPANPNSLEDVYNQFFTACRSGDDGVVRRLLETNEDLDVNVALEAELKDLQIIKKRHGGNVWMGYTPLHLSCDHGRLSVVQELLNQPNIEINLTDKFNQTPLIVACKENRVEVVRLLLTRQEIIVNKGDKTFNRTPLYWACLQDNIGIVQQFVERMDVDVNVATGCMFETSLMTASEKGFSNIVRCLLSHPEINLSKVNSDGKTALTWASEQKHNEILQMLRNHKRNNRRCTVS